jgi:rubrerythrin
MPNFTDPFPGIKETNPMSKDDLVKALRLDLAAEEDAASLYVTHSNATDNPLVIKVLRSISNEERVHIGELLRLIETLDPEETKFLENGAAEVENFKEFAENWR